MTSSNTFTIFRSSIITIFTAMKNLVLLTSFCFYFFTSGLSQGNCSDDDLDYLGDNLDTVVQTAQDCGFNCLFDSDLNGCVTSCIIENTELTPSCSECFGDQVGCLVDNCLTQCPPFGTEATCQDCLIEFCLEDFNVCAGIIDNDEDGIDNIFDCDDTNNSIYPDAPGTFEGIDNNCDGEIIGDELTIEPGPCAGDLDSDLAVTVIDLGILLGDFGCSGANCVADITEDGVTNISDISSFLGAFGAECD